MDGNLTLKISDSVLKKAVSYASRKGVDLSTVVEDFLTNLASDVNTQKNEEKAITKSKGLPKHLKKIEGSLSGIAESDSSDDARLSYLLKKYK